MDDEPSCTDVMAPPASMIRLRSLSRAAIVWKNSTVSFFNLEPRKMSQDSVHPIAQGGFDKLDTSQIYERARPSYSKDVANFLLDKLGIATFDASSSQPFRILELGTGTGKFTGTLRKVLRDSKVQIIASEPLLSMREEFRRKHPDITIKDFAAENIGRESQASQAHV